MKKTVFKYPTTLIPLKIENDVPSIFRESLINIPYLLYEVETLKNGNKIVINKPGGKRNFGRIAKNDFLVYIYDNGLDELWLISHKEIFLDLEEKAKKSPQDTIKLIDGLYKVCKGENPEIILDLLMINELVGISPEIILKAYKWIWGQEDCNYPTKKGRWMSMESILEFRELIIKNNDKSKSD